MTNKNQPQSSTGVIDPIQYRVIFSSPFFEVEVANGWQRWQTVRSQEPVPATGRTGESYPVLQFKSHGDAVAYAEQTLGLSARKLGWWKRLLRRLTPPANPSASRAIGDDGVMEVPVKHAPPAPLTVVHGTTNQ